MDTTRTVKYLIGRSPEGVTRLEAPTLPSPEGRVPISRLGCGFTSKIDYTQEQLRQTIAEAGETILFLCDSSFFDTRTDESVFETLLSRRAGLVVIPSVFKESEEWAKNNKNLLIARSLIGRHRGIKLVHMPNQGESALYSYAYFTRLLGARKLLFLLIRQDFERVHGRQPTDEEMRDLARNAHDKSIGPCGYMIGKKAANKPPGSTFYTDEEIVVTAFMLAVGLGIEIVILTKDEDIQEQFYKMQYLLDTQYRSMLFADSFADNPSSFTTNPLLKSSDRISDAFMGDDNILIQKPGDNLKSILPEQFRSVCVYCWVAGEKMSQMVFNAETGMKRLFDMKARTGGLNTDRLDGRNCHTCLDPLPIMPSGLWAAVARDVMVQQPECSIPLLEINQAMNANERFYQVVYE